jgi:recombinational DNA repair protein RecR
MLRLGGHGLPVGSELEYADEVTLARHLSGARRFGRL